VYTLPGVAVSETVGAGAVTVTVTDCAALPPGPLQVRVKFAFAVRAPVDWEPLIGSPPLHASEAVQLVAFAVVQVSVEELPLTTVLGLALKLMEGGGGVTDTVADCAALPPGPEQVRV
jgi:hypothetical protein